jgi:hypothetical protein
MKTYWCKKLSLGLNINHGARGIKYWCLVELSVGFYVEGCIEFVWWT